MFSNFIGLNELVFHITGKLTVSPKSITVRFGSHDDPGVIATHICSNEIVFPHGFLSNIPQDESHDLLASFNAESCYCRFDSTQYSVIIMLKVAVFL